MRPKTWQVLVHTGIVLLLALLALFLPVGPGLASSSSPDDPVAEPSPSTPRGAAAASEGRWVWQNPLPMGNTLLSVAFVDANTGWAVGVAGTILKTTDGGTTWTRQTSGVLNWLQAVTFADANTGWAVGSGGTILRYYDPYRTQALLPFLVKNYSAGW